MMPAIRRGLHVERLVISNPKQYAVMKGSPQAKEYALFEDYWPERHFFF
jgi:hypothetical protein